MKAVAFQGEAVAPSCPPPADAYSINFFIMIKKIIKIGKNFCIDLIISTLDSF